MTGTLSGRGAYLCRDANCLGRAFKTRALERALEAQVTDALKEALEAETAKNGPAV